MLIYNYRIDNFYCGDDYCRDWVEDRVNFEFKDGSGRGYANGFGDLTGACYSSGVSLPI